MYLDISQINIIRKMITKIAVSYFKAHCLEIFENLQTSQNSMIITKRDKPIAKIIPINSEKISLFGLLKHKAEIKTDIVEPIDSNWNAENE